MRINMLSKFEPFNIMFKESSDSFTTFFHSHNSHEIVFVIEGEIEIDICSKIYKLRPGSIVFFSSMESHQIKAISFPYKRYILSIHHDYFQSIITDPLLLSIFKNRPVSFTHTINLSPILKNQISQLFHQMCMEIEGKEPFYDKILADYLRHCLILLYRNYPEMFPILAGNESSKIVLAIQKYIDNNYTEELSLGKLSKKYGINMYHLSRRFKEITGYGFSEYINKIRISHAKDALIYSERTLSSIASELGFCSTPHFISYFKRITGYTPNVFRNSFKK